LGVPGIVGVAQILHDNGTLGEVQDSGFVDLVLPGRSDGHKGGQVAAVIQEGMPFDSAFGAAARSPREPRQTEAHHRGVEAEELVFKLEFVLRCQRLQRWYIKPNNASKKEAGRRLWASAKVERATGLTPKW
jgi:hypothetical protein